MLHPLKDNVLVAALDDPDTWYGSSLIVRPEATKDRSDQGIVKSVGPETQEIEVGDYVMFNPYSGMVINDADEGDKLIMLSEKGILARVTTPDTEIPGAFISTESGMVPATAEALILLLRAAYASAPRFLELKDKFSARLVK
jgi:co-chaperonin GroES (HSP10)